MKTSAKTRTLLLLSGLGLATAPGNAQTNGPLPIHWQATYGAGKVGSGSFALAYDFAQTADGGYLIAGIVGGAANGIRTAPICAGTDYWVIKIDAQGQRQWDKSYGGDSHPEGGPGDTCFAFTLSPDDGFVLTGWSFSTKSCTRTVPLLDWSDMWTVRCDATGTVLWDVGFTPGSASMSHLATDIERTRDGAYVVCGMGQNADGSILYRMILKFNDQGEEQLSKAVCNLRTYGIPLRIRETLDGGFIIAGSAADPPMGCKTSPYFGGHDSSNVYLGGDFWVLRLDAQGNPVWDKSYGGSGPEQAYDIHPLADGGFMVFGSSESTPAPVPSRGTKTSPRYGQQDFWVVRIDAQGNPLWDKSYGGTGDDICTHAEPMPDGGWLLCGQSSSPASASKTSPRFGSFDFWIVRTDDRGNKLWEQSFGGSGMEGKTVRPMTVPQFVRQRIRHTADGGFLLVGDSDSPVGGTKTAPRVGDYDFWVLKLGPEPPSLRGEVTAEGQCKLCLIGPPEFPSTIQGSADLVSWADLATPPNPTGKVCWTDPDKAAHRFYRAVRK